MKSDFAGKQYLRPELPPTPKAVWWVVGAFQGILLLIVVVRLYGGV